MNDIIRRKVAHAVLTGGEGGPGADHGWRLAFARAARDSASLMVEVAAMSVRRRSLAELLELPPERALLALLDGPQGGLGLLVMSAEVMGALIEMQTTGRVSAAPPLTRRPTRTDAAMVAGVIDRALEELDSVLAEEADLVWAGGFRYASFLEDPRPLGLLLEDHGYRVLSADLSLSAGARTGGLILALPAEGRGLRPVPKPGQADRMAAAPAHSFSDGLGEAVMAADCTLDAVIGRIRLPLRDVMALQVGQVLAMPKAALDRIGLEGINGNRVAVARLGQQQGMRALRLSQGLAGAAPGINPGLNPGMGGQSGPSAAPSATMPGFPGTAPHMGLPATVSPSGTGLVADDPYGGFAAPLDLGDGLLAAG